MIQLNVVAMLIVEEDLVEAVEMAVVALEAVEVQSSSIANDAESYYDADYPAASVSRSTSTVESS